MKSNCQLFFIFHFSFFIFYFIYLSNLQVGRMIWWVFLSKSSYEKIKEGFIHLKSIQKKWELNEKSQIQFSIVTHSDYFQLQLLTLELQGSSHLMRFGVRYLHDLQSNNRSIKIVGIIFANHDKEVQNLIDRKDFIIKCGPEKMYNSYQSSHHLEQHPTRVKSKDIFKEPCP